MNYLFCKLKFILKLKNKLKYKFNLQIKTKMKKFGRQAQYYHNNENNTPKEKYFSLNNNNADFDYDDPVDLEFINEFTEKSNIKSRANNKNEDYNTPKFNTPRFNTPYSNGSNASNSKSKNNNTSTNVHYIRLSELDDSNPYNCLDVSQMATQEEIRKAYKKLIFLYHPDKGGDGEKFNKIHEAYEILSNPITKNIIDTFGSMSLDLVKSILINDLLSNKQIIDDINFCIKQNDYTQLYFLINNIRT